MVTSVNNPTRPSRRTQMSRCDRIARIVRRTIQRCTCELNAGSHPGAGAGVTTRYGRP